MKVLRVISTMNPTSGGPCQGIRNSIPELEKLGVHNEVVCLDVPEADFIGLDNLTIHAIGEGKGPWFYHKALLPWLLANLSRFDVVIIHGLWLYSSYAVRVAMRRIESNHKRKAIPKVFVMPHGMLDPWFQRAKGRKLRAVRNFLYWKLIESAVVNNADGILFTSEEELRLARQPFRPYNPKREWNVGYGIVPPPAYRPAMQRAFKEVCPEVGDEPYLLFLSRIDIKKGVDLLISAYLSLKKEGYELPTLVVAGPGKDSPYGTEVQKLASEDKNVLFPGMLTGDAKWGAFYGCEAFILPSHQENFGIAVVEALACSKPVLISNQVNIWGEIVKEGGGLARLDTVDGVKDLLISWTNFSAIEKLEITNKARKIYEKHFTIEQAAERLVAVLTFNSEKEINLKESVD